MLVVHCSDTPDDEQLRAIDIQHMHLGFGWDGIGYHYVIGRDGRCEAGRPEFWQGAHVRGVNDVSLGVCLIGRTNFTTAQMHRLELLLRDWTARYPQARVVGHRHRVVGGELALERGGPAAGRPDAPRPFGSARGVRGLASRVRSPSAPPAASPPTAARPSRCCTRP